MNGPAPGLRTAAAPLFPGEGRRRFPRADYNQRWHVESGFSRHKRRLGSALTARRTPAQRRELVLRVLVHNLMILRSHPEHVNRALAALSAVKRSPVPRPR